MADSLGELFVELGVFADTKELKQFKDKLEKIKNTMDKTGKKADKLNINFQALRRNLKAATVAITAAFYAINKLTDSLIQSNQSFLNLTRNSDIALGTFQKWNNIGRMFGVNNAAQQIASLNQRLFELKLTGQGAEGFMLAGINPLGQDAEGIMEQLRNRVSGLNDTAATFLLSKMGLDPSMLHLLRLSREEFEELGRTVNKYQLTRDQREQIQALNIQLEIARIKLQYLKDRAIMQLLPHFIAFMNSLVSVATILKDIGKTTDQLLQKFPLLKTAIKTLGVVLLAVFHPFYALFGALYLILDDVSHYMNGGGSVIGVIAKAMQDFREKGFFSDDVPKWIQLLATAADKLYEIWQSHQQRVAEKAETAANNVASVLQNELKDSTIQAIKGADGSYGFAHVMPKPNMVTNTSNITDNRQVTMNNNINTAEAAGAVYDNLMYLSRFSLNPMWSN